MWPAPVSMLASWASERVLRTAAVSGEALTAHSETVPWTVAGPLGACAGLAAGLRAFGVLVEADVELPQPAAPIASATAAPATGTMRRRVMRAGSPTGRKGPVK